MPVNANISPEMRTQVVRNGVSRGLWVYAQFNGGEDANPLVMYDPTLTAARLQIVIDLLELERRKRNRESKPEGVPSKAGKHPNSLRALRVHGCRDAMGDALKRRFEKR